MKKYSVISLLFDSSHDVSNLDFNSFESYFDALSNFYYLVGYYSSISNCSVRSFENEDTDFIKNTRVDSGKKSFYIYIKKNS